MGAEAWILRMSYQVSTNLKSALLLEPSKNHNPKKGDPKQLLGFLSLEVANAMSHTIHLHHSLSHSHILKLKHEISRSQGIHNLVSSDHQFLMGLALAEKLHDLNRVAGVVSRLGKKCSEAALQGFEHVYADIISGGIDVKKVGCVVKDMDAMVRKMERYVIATSNLFGEMEALIEMEKGSNQQNLIWQTQAVAHLKHISLWNLTYDDAVDLLGRSLCTLYARICLVFGHNPNLQFLGGDGFVQPLSSKSIVVERWGSKCKPSPARNSQRRELHFFRPEDLNFPCGAIPGRLFLKCLSLSNSVPKWNDNDNDDDDLDERSSQISGRSSVGNRSVKREHLSHARSAKETQYSVPWSGDQRQAKPSVTKSSMFNPKSNITGLAPPSTVGGSALSLRYANLIIVIEKLLHYPHLVDEEARDHLYQMLPMSLRMCLKSDLKAYGKNPAIYDAPLARDWKLTVAGILGWLAPLAHNMIKWQNERNFEQQDDGGGTKVLLLQTLYFGDRGKTEAAICKLLVGLNYICRYEQQKNALLDCASSCEFDDCVEWQLQY